MTLEKLKRVMWRLDEVKDIVGIVSLAQIVSAIMDECGTDDRTIKMNLKRLKQLGWLQGIFQKRWRYKLNKPND